MCNNYDFTMYVYINISEFERHGLTPEEAEQEAIAKRKMLGNIRFVGKCEVSN